MEKSMWQACLDKNAWADIVKPCHLQQMHLLLQKQTMLVFDKSVTWRTSFMMVQVSADSVLNSCFQSFLSPESKDFRISRSVQWGQRVCQSLPLFSLENSSHHSRFPESTSHWEACSKTPPISSTVVSSSPAAFLDFQVVWVHRASEHLRKRWGKSSSYFLFSPMSWITSSKDTSSVCLQQRTLHTVQWTTTGRRSQKGEWGMCGSHFTLSAVQQLPCRRWGQAAFE